MNNKNKELNIKAIAFCNYDDQICYWNECTEEKSQNNHQKFEYQILLKDLKIINVKTFELMIFQDINNNLYYSANSNIIKYELFSIKKENTKIEKCTLYLNINLDPSTIFNELSKNQFNKINDKIFFNNKINYSQLIDSINLLDKTELELTNIKNSIINNNKI